MSRPDEILLYEEGDNFYSYLRKNKHRVIFRSTSGFTHDIVVQEFINDNWLDINQVSKEAREVIDDCVYFSSMSYLSRTPERDERKKKGLPLVEGYNVGP
jgi:hypothetical protein